MVINHIGIVTKSLANSILQWKNTFGYVQSTEIVHNSVQQVNVVFMKKEKSIEIKLIEPSDESSPIYKFAKKGGGLHHLCFYSKDMDKTLGFMKNEKCLLISPPQPGEAFNNQNIAFILAQNNLNIELIDTLERAHIISE